MKKPARTTASRASRFFTGAAPTAILAANGVDRLLLVLFLLDVVDPRLLDEDLVDLPPFQRLALQELAGDAVERVLVRGDDLVGGLVGRVENAAHFPVDLDRRRLGVVLMLRELAAEEDRLFLL